jgi:hypothetical protein
MFHYTCIPCGTHRCFGRPFTAACCLPCAPTSPPLLLQSLDAPSAFYMWHSAVPLLSSVHPFSSVLSPCCFTLQDESLQKLGFLKEKEALLASPASANMVPSVSGGQSDDGGGGYFGTTHANLLTRN